MNATEPDDISRKLFVKINEEPMELLWRLLTKWPALRLKSLERSANTRFYQIELEPVPDDDWDKIKLFVEGWTVAFTDV